MNKTCQSIRDLPGIRAIITLMVLLGFLTAFSGPAEAAASPWVIHDEARVRLIAAADTAGKAGDLNLGIHFEMEPGWKINWRFVGDAGVPTSVDWTGSDNLLRPEIIWPVPLRFSIFGLETFGYSGEVVLPIKAEVERRGEAVTLHATVKYLVCKDICIPHDDVVRLDLPPGVGTPSPEGDLISRFQDLVPGDGSAIGLSLEDAVLTGPLAEPLLQVAVRSTVPFDTPDVIIEGPPEFNFGKPEIRLEADGRRAILSVATAKSLSNDSVLEGKRLVLTVTDGQRGMEQTVIARFASPLTVSGSPASAFLGILGLALLGGLILNLMPCVLPVLSMKLLSVVSQGGRARRDVRMSFVASAAGILFSFLVLAGGLVALKAGGVAVGWGIQFQQPLFLVAMALLVTLFAYNLFGFFEIAMPGWVGSLDARAAGHGTGTHSLAGHFMTGALATLLATPCSAPFLGTAVGFALARGAGEIFLIFAALGLGLALPYLLVAAVPGLAMRLPRPGAWMVIVRRILGLALMATTVWLLSVLSVQVGPPAAIVAGILLLAIGLTLWVGRDGRGLQRRAGLGLTALLAVSVFALPASLGMPQDPASRSVTVDYWLPLDAPEIPLRVAEGKLVFVDVTADWCITCQANKKLVLDRAEIVERLTSENVVAMRGDWTSPSDEIMRYLEGFGRYGIPFNAVYGPGAPNGIALPELLTVNTVMDALGRAAGNGSADTAGLNNKGD
ncbi:protein-disulfide reductase DsbD [Thalassospira profundimaris]|uniref:protein-disulfide reductase DsbD family protein n=1 Tax=Thalassospira profundimaris TaxID=502049 RepID=UPI000DEDFD48|nr:protein-disulfide reductase DsbD domain-containing protein [Thalassospira profundimaris]